MKLDAVVSRIDSAHGYSDKQQRIFLKVAQAEGDMYNEIKLPNADGYQLDDELTLLVLTKEQTTMFAKDLVAALDSEGEFYRPALAELRDQLRPDEPPPWEQPKQAGQILDEIINICRSQPDEAQAEKAKLGGTAR